MLPHYPNNNPRRRHHHHHCAYQQEQPLPPNPTAAAAFLMPATAASSWDDEYGGQIFPGADMYSQQQETLEAVLRQRVTSSSPPLLPEQPSVLERESSSRDGAPAADGAAAAAARAAAAVPRRRPVRTDRHSKIHTAQGVRDRRMRLSVGVARDFFALQDRLGFDKPSKTVNWLLTQSKPAIDRLCDGGAAAPGAPAPFRPSVAMAKGKGEGMMSSTSTVCFTDARERARISRGVLDAPVALMEDHGCRDQLDWTMSETAAASAAATELMQPMEHGLEYYQYYQYQLEEMMRCNNGGVLPR